MRIAVFQGPEQAFDVAGHLDALARAAASAAAVGAELLVTPEMSATGYNIGDRARELAEPADGSIAERIAGLCSELGLGIAYGYPELDGEAVHNAVQVIGPTGVVLASYRKTHLFGDIDRGRFEPGSDLVVQFPLGQLTCGLAICYDVEFPELARAHGDAGTDLLVAPTGLMRPFEVVSRILVPARAYENQMYVAYANRCGAEGDLEYCGLSCVVGPGGDDVARAGAGETLLVADVGRDVLAASRAVNTHLQDRRRDLYDWRRSNNR
jgi:predicted amidohydrolase